MSEVDMEQASIEDQLEFWKSFVEGMSKALHETRKAYREKCMECHELKEKLKEAQK
jgi:hypothetical protein